MLWLLHQFENFPFKYVRKFGKYLLKILGDNSSLGSVGVKNATRAIIRNIFFLSFFFSLHLIALLLAIKKHNFEPPVSTVWTQEQANSSWMKHQYLVLHDNPSQIMVYRFWENIFSSATQLFRKNHNERVIVKYEVFKIFLLNPFFLVRFLSILWKIDPILKPSQKFSLCTIILIIGRDASTFQLFKVCSKIGHNSIIEK